MIKHNRKEFYNMRKETNFIISVGSKQRLQTASDTKLCLEPNKLK